MTIDKSPHFKLTVSSLAPARIPARLVPPVGPLGSHSNDDTVTSAAASARADASFFLFANHELRGVGGFLGEWQEISPGIALCQHAGLRQHPGSVMVEVVEGFGAAESSLRRISDSVTKLPCPNLFPFFPLSFTHHSCFLSSSPLSFFSLTMLLLSATITALLLIVLLLYFIVLLLWVVAVLYGF